MDAQLSSDGTIVIFHDLSVDRLTEGIGKVESKTLAELKTLDLSIKYGHGFSHAYVATFEDFVQAISTQGILMIELKVPGIKQTGIEQKAIDTIKKYNAYDHVYLSSFNPFVLYRLKKLDPKIHTVLIFMDTNWNPQLLAEIKKEDLVNLPWFLRKEWTRRAIRKFVKPDALSVNNEVSEGTIDFLIRDGYPIFLWTVETKERIQWALDKKPYGIISDEPALGKELRDATK
jgi:glycerophosphoryl diester phosphodiesterase